MAGSGRLRDLERFRSRQGGGRVRAVRPPRAVPLPQRQRRWDDVTVTTGVGNVGGHPPPPLESGGGDPPRADLAAAALSNLDMVAAALPSPDHASPPIPARICQRWLWEEDDNFGDDGRTNTTVAATTIGF